MSFFSRLWEGFVHNTKHKPIKPIKSFLYGLPKIFTLSGKIIRRKILIAKLKFSHQNGNSHGNIKLLTAKENLSRWKKSFHDKTRKIKTLAGKNVKCNCD